MQIVHDNTLSKTRLPKSHTMLFNSHITPSKLNIQLKTHSLTCLDIPLKTSVGLNEISSSLRSDQQRTMAGSVDLTSEIQQLNNDKCYPFSSSKPSINGVSSNEHRASVKHRFRISNSFLTPTSINDSIARLRRSGHLQNIYQSSLQTIDTLTERKRRLSLIHIGPIPKFTFRDLPSKSRPSSPTNQLEQSSKSRMSPFTSLPEIRSFVEQNSLYNTKDIMDKPKFSQSSAFSGWKKSRSWSWKSSNAIQLNSVNNEPTMSNITTKDIENQVDNDIFRSHLPVIVESPLQQRAPLQSINQKKCHSPMRLLNIHRSNLSLRSEKIPQNSNRLYQKKSSFPHSISNYEVSPSRFSSRPTTRYPSTPLLAYSRHKKNDKYEDHSIPIDMSPIAIFDDDHSISSDSSFRSCFNSVNDLSENNTTELSSSSSSESCFQEIPSSYDLNTGTIIETMKQTRSSFRHLCTIQ